MMKTKYVVISFFTIVIVVMVGAVIQTIVTVPGGARPNGAALETPGLAAKLSGIVLTEGADDEIDATSLPLGITSIVVPQPQGTILAISGPDAAGRIAYLAKAYATDIRLHITAIGGAPDTIVFRSESPGSPNYGDVASFALSPKGGQVAIVNLAGGVQTPIEFFTTGQLEIWDVVRKIRRPLPAHVLDDGLAWMPDSRRLIVVEMSPNPTVRDYQDYGMQDKAWTSLPTAYMLDTVTGKKTKIGAGVWPVVSTDGKFVILDNNSRQPRQVNLATLQSQPLTLPGRHGVILTQDGPLVVYGATGVSGTFTYSHGGIGPLGAVKTAQINTTKFQTLLPKIDTLSPMSYGATTPQNQKLLASTPKK